MNGRRRTSYRLFSAVVMAVGSALCAALACAQDNAAPVSAAQAVGASPVPRLINFSGTINRQIAQTEMQSPGASRAINVTFSLYELQEGGAPLWSESQKVQLDEQGHYTVLLGATQPDGLPLDLFTSGKAQWLGVQPQLPGAGEQPRVLLVGMPYALKAADADTLGGLPVSAFVQAGAQAYESAPAAATSSASLGTQAATEQALPAAPGGSGTTDFLPLWTNSTTLGNSVLFQSGTGSTAKVGLNTTTPASTLDVNGAGTVRGTLSLPATGPATAPAGKNSQPASLQASAYDSTTKAAVKETFNLQAEPTGNDTASPSGKLSLLFASGSATPSETGLSISSNGKIAFASGQTFPGTGTITGVTTATGSGLTGGGSTGTLSLSLEKSCASSQVLQWNGSSWVCAAMPVGTITGVKAGTDLTGGGTSGTVTLNLDTTKVPQLSGSNTFTVNQNFKGNGNSAQIGDMGCGPGYVGLSLFPSGGANCTGYALLGDTAGNLFVNRPTGGYLVFRENNGTELTMSPGGGITATGNIAAASFTGDGSTLSNIAGLFANNTFSGFNYFQQDTTFIGTGGEGAVVGDMGCGGSSVGITFQAIDCAHYALLDYGGQTILNRTSGQNMSFREGNGGDQMTLLSGGGINLNPGSHQVTVSANGTEADYGGSATVTVANYTTDTNTLMFLAIAPNNSNANCWIVTSGDLACNGNLLTAPLIDGGSRVVGLYATHSPENWFEDYGSATLANGVAEVTLEPIFAQTISTAAAYHVFVTPKGDCRGLYVTNETATSFEVHELGGGQANIDFDYRIIGKRKGYENVRLADLTERVNRLKEHALEPAPAAKEAVVPNQQYPNQLAGRAAASAAHLAPRHP